MDDATYIARGKYSTLAGERRAALKALQEDMQALTNYAHRIIRAAGDRALDIDFLAEELANAGRRVGSAHGHVQTIMQLAPLLAELKAPAWGGKEPE